MRYGGKLTFRISSAAAAARARFSRQGRADTEFGRDAPKTSTDLGDEPFSGIVNMTCFSVSRHVKSASIGMGRTR